MTKGTIHFHSKWSGSVVPALGPPVLGIQADVSSQLQFRTPSSTPPQRMANEGMQRPDPLASVGGNSEGPSQLLLRICWGLSCNCFEGQLRSNSTFLIPVLGSCPHKLFALTASQSISRKPSLRQRSEPRSRKAEWFARSLQLDTDKHLFSRRES